MKGLTPRRGLLGGILLIAVGVLAYDRVSGSRQPATARAADSKPAPELAPADWEPIAALVARLTTSTYVPVGEDLARLDRDVFVPTSVIQEAVAPAAPAAPASGTAETGDTNPTVPAGFPARHKLAGVMLTGQPLAVVDDRLLAVGSELDGHVLIEIQRDAVVFRQPSTGARARLELEGPKKR